MKARTWLTATLLAALLAPGVARADGLKGRFSIAFQAGTQSEISGDIMKAAEGTLVGKPVTFESKRYRDVYAPDLRLHGLVGYGVGERTEIIARGTWYEADAVGLQVGTLGEKPVYAFFEPYEEVGVEVGLRYYIAAAGRLKSYIAPVVGARFLTEVLVSFHVPDAGTVHPQHSLEREEHRADVRSRSRLHLRPGVALLHRRRHEPALPVRSLAARRPARLHADRRQRRQVVGPGGGVARRQVLMSSRGKSRLLGPEGSACQS